MVSTATYTRMSGWVAYVSNDGFNLDDLLHSSYNKAVILRVCVGSVLLLLLLLLLASSSPGVVVTLAVVVAGKVSLYLVEALGAKVYHVHSL